MKLCPYIITGRIHPRRSSVYKWRNQSDMNNEAWWTWKSSIKNTFTYDGIHLRKPLGTWLQTDLSQHWAAYRTADGTLCIAPDAANPFLVSFPPLAITPNGIQYDIMDSPGTSCNPPKEAYNISLSSGTPNTLVYTDSNSYPVILNLTQTIPQTDSAILRLLGPKIQ